MAGTGAVPHRDDEESTRGVARCPGSVPGARRPAGRGQPPA